MKEYIVQIQNGNDETSRYFLHYLADDISHAEEQALDESKENRAIAIYERVS